MTPPRPFSPVEAFEVIQTILDTSDSVSWTQHARDRAVERNFTADDVRHVLRRGLVSASPAWDEKFQDWKYTVSGTDCDGCALAVVVALDPLWARITLITGRDTK